VNSRFQLSLQQRIRKAAADTARWKRNRKHPVFKQLHLRRQRRYKLLQRLEICQEKLSEINKQLVANGKELAKYEQLWKEVKSTLGEKLWKKNGTLNQGPQAPNK
jgi:hypothetical protein